MKIAYYIGIIICTSLFVTCNSLGQETVYDQVKFERRKLQKSSYVIKQPVKADRMGESGKKYDPKLRVVEVDPKTGKYEYRWIGSDGKEKVVTYQRADSIRAIAAADVRKDADGKFIFTYKVEVLPSSPIYFRNFIVQTFGFSAENSGHNKDNFLVGEMYPVGDFKDGKWRNWAYVGSDQGRIINGTSITFQLSSENPPGIVKCRIGGGEFGSLAADEEMPSALENEMPVNEDLAKGYTIGPDERLLKLSDSGKINYLIENLPKFQEAGWMSDGTAKNYEQILKKNDLWEVLQKAKKDLDNEFISSEVFGIIERLSP